VAVQVTTAPAGLVWAARGSRPPQGADAAPVSPVTRAWSVARGTGPSRV